MTVLSGFYFCCLFVVNPWTAFHRNHWSTAGQHLHNSAQFDCIFMFAPRQEHGSHPQGNTCDKRAPDTYCVSRGFNKDIKTTARLSRNRLADSPFPCKQVCAPNILCKKPDLMSEANFRLSRKCSSVKTLPQLFKRTGGRLQKKSTFMTNTHLLTCIKLCCQDQFSPEIVPRLQ